MTKKVKVRVAVAVNKDGLWAAYGGSHCDDIRSSELAELNVPRSLKLYFLESELEIPEVLETVQADVVEVK